MDLADSDIVDALLQRDGPQSYRSHVVPDRPCPYASMYRDGACPWCEADERKAGAA